MAQQRNIGLTISLNGTEQVISNLEQLENTVNELKTQLKGVDIGSKEWDELTAKIRQADGALKTLQERAEGKKAADVIGDYTKIGSTIAASFATAQAAFAAFGEESEATAKIAAKAQVALAAALTIREGAEAATVIKARLNVITTYAEAKAATAANVATKAFWTTLAANPLTAVLVVLGAVVASLIAFTDETEEAAEAQKTLNEYQLENRQSTAAQVLQLRTLQKILNDTTVSLDAQEGAYQMLQKSVPTLNNLTLEQAKNQGLLNAAIQEEIDLIQLRAEIKALEDYIVEQEKEKLRLANEAQKAAKLQAALDREIYRGKQAQVAYSEKELETAMQWYDLTHKADFSTPQEQLLQKQTELSEIEGKRAKALKDLQDQEARTKATEQERQAQMAAFVKLLGEEQKKRAELLIQTLKLRPLELDSVEIAKERLVELQKYNSAFEEFITFNELYTKAQENLKPVEDKKLEYYTEVRKLSETYFNTLYDGKQTEEELAETTRKYYTDIAALKQKYKGLITPEDTVALDDYSASYKELVRTINQFLEAGVEPPFKAEVWEKALIDYNLFVGTITTDPYKRSEDEIQAAKLGAQGAMEELMRSFKESYVALEKERTIKKLKTKTEIEAFSKNYESWYQATLASADIAFNRLLNAGNEIVKFENAMEDVKKVVSALNTEITKLSEDAVEGFFLINKSKLTQQVLFDVRAVQANREKLVEIQEQINRKLYDKQRKFGADVESFEKALAAKGIDISKLSYEAKLILLEDYLAQEVQMTEDAEKKQQEAKQETINKWLESIQQIQSTLQSISQFQAEFYRAQLENLDRESKYYLDKITGDTKEAQAKRLETEEYYQKKREELEKKASIQALRISQAMALANAAEAITKITAQTGVLAVIAATAVAAVNAAQIGIIQTQINSINKYQRGGIIKGQGGMVVGPSHEYGGVRFGQGGLELEGGEFVINRNSSVRYSELLNQINLTGGGRDMSVTNFDDSRIVEAIAKQRNEPIRAYVVESDITNKQAIAQRLERLSQF